MLNERERERERERESLITHPLTYIASQGHKGNSIAPLHTAPHCSIPLHYALTPPPTSTQSCLVLDGRRHHTHTHTHTHTHHGNLIHFRHNDTRGNSHSCSLLYYYFPCFSLVFFFPLYFFRVFSPLQLFSLTFFFLNQTQLNLI